jgi:hypothetical protein
MSSQVEMVQLSYSQSKIIARAIAPILKEQKNRSNAARLFGVKEYVIQRLATPKAKIMIAREGFEVIVAMLGVDTHGWDIQPRF